MALRSAPVWRWSLPGRGTSRYKLRVLGAEERGQCGWSRVKAGYRYIVGSVSVVGQQDDRSCSDT